MRLSPVLALAALLALVGCRPADGGERELVVFAAASAGPALRLVERAFEERHSGVDVRIELSGSRAAVHKVTDQGRRADLVVSADHELVDEMRPGHASFVLDFAKNALVLAYAPTSPAGRALEAGEPWQEVLAREGVRVGIANPAFAPVGYRALLALSLNDRIAPEGLRTGAEIQARIERAHQRPDVAKLLAPLEAGELDAAFVYVSEARQRGLPYLPLDPRIDFSDPAHAPLYAEARLVLPPMGNEPPREVRGQPARYGLTIPRSAEHPELAAAFVRLLLSDEGRALAQRAHLDVLPAEALALRGEAPFELSP